MYDRWRPFIMNRFIILLTLMSLRSFGQEKDLEIDKHLTGQGRTIVMSFINDGHRNFIFVDRMHPGLMHLKNYDRCKDISFLKFILVKTDSKKYEFIKYDNCGQTSVTTDSKALKFFEENRVQIDMESIDDKGYIDHAVFYSLYEIRNGKLMTYKEFCKESVDLEEDMGTKNKNQGMKMYKFFSMLDTELSELIK